MSDTPAEFQCVTVTPPDPRFAFSIEAPTAWAQMALPEDAWDSSDEVAFQPVAVFAARYGIVVLTFSVRPAFETGTVAEWMGRLCAAEGIEFSEIGPAQAGGIQGVGAMGTQESQAGSMTMRVVMFEQGGWAHTLMGMAPTEVWDSLSPTFDRMFASFAMVTEQPPTVTAWPSDDEMDDAHDALPDEADLALARQMAELFLDAVLQGDEATARSLLVAADSGSVNFPATADGRGGYELGQPQADGADVVVEARLQSCPPGQSQVQEQVMPLVLRREEGLWKVDTGASIERMLGVDMEKGLKDLAESFGRMASEGLADIMDGLGELAPDEDSPEDPPAPLEGQ